MLIDKILGIKWQIGTYAFGAALIGLGIYTAVLRADNGRLERRVTSLSEDIVQSKSNVSVLQSAVNDQNEALAEMQRQAQQRITALNVQLAAAQKARKVAEGKTVRLTTHQIKGDTLEARIRDVDAEVMETLR